MHRALQGKLVNCGIGMQLLNQRRQRLAAYSQPPPAALHTPPFRGRPWIEISHYSLTVEHACADSRGTVASAFAFDVVINRGRENAEVGLLQPAQHFTHDGEGFVVGSGVQDPWLELGMNQLPVEAAWVFLPGLVANGAPDLFEASDLALFSGRERLREKAHRKRAHRRDDHS